MLTYIAAYMCGGSAGFLRNRHSFVLCRFSYCHVYNALCISLVGFLCGCAGAAAVERQLCVCAVA